MTRADIIPSVPPSLCQADQSTARRTSAASGQGPVQVSDQLLSPLNTGRLFKGRLAKRFTWQSALLGDLYTDHALHPGVANWTIVLAGAMRIRLSLKRMFELRVSRFLALLTQRARHRLPRP